MNKAGRARASSNQKQRCSYCGEDGARLVIRDGSIAHGRCAKAAELLLVVSKAMQEPTPSS